MKMLVEASLYHATPEEVIAVLNGVQDQGAATVLIVGHNPGLEDFVQQLTGEHHDLPTTALVHITLTIDRWSELDSASAASVVDTWQPR
jgi:phosphohistidine phosphatase